MTNPTKESLEIAKKEVRSFVSDWEITFKNPRQPDLEKRIAQALDSHGKTQFERARNLEFYRATDYLRKLCWSEKDIKAFHDWGRTYELPEDKR